MSSVKTNTAAGGQIDVYKNALNAAGIGLVNSYVVDSYYNNPTLCPLPGFDQVLNGENTAIKPFRLRVAGYASIGSGGNLNQQTLSVMVGSTRLVNLYANSFINIDVEKGQTISLSLPTSYKANLMYQCIPLELLN